MFTCLGPTSSSIGENLKSAKVSIPKNSKVANYASVPLVMDVELGGSDWLGVLLL
ncbi:hypothetical protein [Clostridium senegalense]|uniref:Uncharacterized protein n=1 Tax=Clostridium senegalense TaxID=1465809 RepID=A0A6M0H9W6_9CLOT|nr:hypothetical protein [Clostridium senegalense]NEU06442.1 hypothetical protein [Clostridium senegalense]